MKKSNIYIFEDNDQNEMSEPIINFITELICKDKKWTWQSKPLNMRDLCFANHQNKTDFWQFDIIDFESGKCYGHGALTKLNSLKKPFFEYLFVQLSDSTTIQAWTEGKSIDKTYISVNGEIRGYIQSYWKKYLLNCFNWRESCSFFWDKTEVGTVEAGDYLFKNRKKCYRKGLVRPDSLKLKKKCGDFIPIRLAPDEGSMAGFALIPIKIPLVLLGQRFDTPDYVIPKTEDSVVDEDVLIAFVTNIIFRELFFDQSYIKHT